MKYFDTIFHLLTGGLEFLEISAKLKPDFKIEQIDSALKRVRQKKWYSYFYCQRNAEIRYREGYLY